AYIPQEWKIHRITPIFKSGDRTLVKNYRPISLLCIVSKILERIIFDKMYDHVTSLTICSRQFGFLRGRSTLQQLLVHLHSIVNSLSSGLQSDVIYLDIKKAFDSVSHDILLTKLWSAGLCGLNWQFFVAYLYGRLQCVSVGNRVSSLLPVTSGVPQGSILGPLLFILYINDLPMSPLHSSLLLFADDSKCHRVIKSTRDCQLLQSDLGLLSNWSETTGLTFNSEKSCVISYHLPRSAPVNFNYTLEGKPIAHRSTYKDLGVVFSNSLSWSTQVDSVLQKAY
uniref:Reverse transcriptase domain-containing protein n=1 Tax=Amphimedon queenslandica TaxID=400682 RepID=A0A1X7SDX7_AMPQE